MKIASSHTPLITPQNKTICLHLPLCRKKSRAPLIQKTANSTYNGGIQTDCCSPANTYCICSSHKKHSLWSVLLCLKALRNNLTLFPQPHTAVIICIHKAWMSGKTLIMSSLCCIGARALFSEIAACNYAVLQGCGIVVGPANAKKSSGGAD